MKTREYYGIKTLTEIKEALETIADNTKTFTHGICDVLDDKIGVTTDAYAFMRSVGDRVGVPSEFVYWFNRNSSNYENRRIMCGLIAAWMQTELIDAKKPYRPYVDGDYI